MRAKGCTGHVYADDAGIVSKSAQGLAKMMTSHRDCLPAVGHTVSEKKTGDHDSTNNRPDNLRSTARHRSNRPEEYTYGPVLILTGRHYPRKR